MRTFYNGTLSEFPDGLPIGAPLSSLVVDVSVDRFETEFLHSTLTPQPHILSWHRYVDDILGVWDGPLPALTNLLDYLNSLHPSINFTLEVGGSSINYLDLTISLTPTLTHINFTLSLLSTANPLTLASSAMVSHFTTSLTSFLLFSPNMISKKRSNVYLISHAKTIFLLM